MLRYVGFWKNPDNKITSWTVKLQMDQQKCSKAIWQKFCKWDVRGYPTRIRFQGGFFWQQTHSSRIYLEKFLFLA